MIASTAHQVVDTVKTTLTKRSAVICCFTILMALIYLIVTLLVIQQRGASDFLLFRKVVNDETMKLSLWGPKDEEKFKNSEINWSLIEASTSMAVIALILQLLSSTIVLSEKWILWYVVSLLSVFFNLLSFIFPFFLIKKQSKTDMFESDADGIYFHQVSVKEISKSPSDGFRYLTSAAYLGVACLNLLFWLILLGTIFCIQVIWPKIKKKTEEEVGTIHDYSWSFWKNELMSRENYITLTSFGSTMIHLVVIICVFVGLGDGTIVSSYTGKLEDGDRLSKEAKGKYVEDVLNQGLIRFSLSLAITALVIQIVFFPIGLLLKRWRAWAIGHFVLAILWFGALTIPFYCSNIFQDTCSDKTNCCNFFHSVDIKKFRAEYALKDERLSANGIYTRKRDSRIILFEIAVAYLFFNALNTLLSLCLGLVMFYREKIDKMLKK